MNYYYTYFDKNYLSRGLALLMSLRRHGGLFRLFVLCLDNEAYTFLKGYSKAEIVPIRLAALEAADPDLLKVKESRVGADYLFTLTPCIALYLMDRLPEIGLLTYLDSDLFFFRSPDAVFEEIGDASIAIVPHRFSSANYQLREYGIFNVGWVSWRRDNIGLQCLEEYRNDCLKWCHDYIDGHRYADQRYLDGWPSVYPSVHVIQHRGANLAPWNLDTYPLRLDDQGVTVSGDPLIFYHFHKFLQNGDGEFDTNFASYVHEPDRLNTDAVNYIYSAYAKVIRRITRMGNVNQVSVGQGVRRAGNVPRYPYADLPLVEALPGGWEDDPQQFPGWEIASVLEAAADYHMKIRRRLNTSVPVVSDIRGYAEVMTLAMTATAVTALRSGPVRLLDWGGALGTTALVIEMAAPMVVFNYHCADLPAVVALGRELTAERASFHEVRQEQCSAFDQDYDVVYSGESLHHCRNWRRITAQLAAAANRWLLLTRIPAVSSVPSFVMAYRMFHTRLRTAAPCWAINRYELLAELKTWGFELVRELPYGSFPYIHKASEQAEVRGYLFRRTAPKRGNSCGEK